MQDKSPGHRSLGRARDVKVFIPTLLGITECRLYAHQNCCTNMHQSYQEVWSPALWSKVNNHLLRFWAFSAAALLAILLFYWLYGGVIAFLLVCFGVSGVLYQVSFYPRVVQSWQFHLQAGDRLLYHPEQPPHSRVFVPTPAIFNLPFDNLFINAR